MAALVEIAMVTVLERRLVVGDGNASIVSASRSLDHLGTKSWPRSMRCARHIKLSGFPDTQIMAPLDQRDKIVFKLRFSPAANSGATSVPHRGIAGLPPASRRRLFSDGALRHCGRAFLRMVVADASSVRST